MKVKVCVSIAVLRYYELEIPDDTPTEDREKAATEALFGDGEAEPYREDCIEWEILSVDDR